MIRPLEADDVPSCAAVLEALPLTSTPTGPPRRPCWAYYPTATGGAQVAIW